MRQPAQDVVHDDAPGGRVTAEEVVCEECGNDTAAEGQRYCTDCLEANPELAE